METPVGQNKLKNGKTVNTAYQGNLTGCHSRPTCRRPSQESFWTHTTYKSEASMLEPTCRVILNVVFVFTTRTKPILLILSMCPVTVSTPVKDRIL